MKLLIVLLCVCHALAVPASNDLLLDELEKLIHTDDTHDNDLLSILSDAEPLTDDDKEWIKKFDAESDKRSAGRYPYGTCIDGRTPADGPNGKGCAKKLCFDMKVKGCKSISKRVCRSKYMYYREECPYSCHFCKARSPADQCKSKYGSRAKYGCCWDGFPRLRAGRGGCRTCSDFSPHTCKQFQENGSCRTGSYRMRSFFFTRCPKSCGFCSED